MRIPNNKFIVWTALVWLLGSSSILGRGQTASAQAAPAGVSLEIGFAPGESLRYEADSRIAFIPISEATTFRAQQAPSERCEYNLHAFLTLRFLKRGQDGSLSGRASYSEVKLRDWQCAKGNRAEIEQRLQQLESSALDFSLNARGELQSAGGETSGLDYSRGISLLRILTLDALETSLGRIAAAPGEDWKPNGQFARMLDEAEADLKLSASTVKFERVQSLAGEPCALLSTRYVLSPEEQPASAPVAGSFLPGQGGNVVGGMVNVSALLDTNTHHLVWIHHAKEIDNNLRVYLYENQPVMTLRYEEESTLRWLRPQDAVEWSAAVEKFETKPGPGTVAKLVSNPGEGKPHPRLEMTGDTDSFDRTPAGFQRMQKTFCATAWSCLQASLALPGKIEVQQDEPEAGTLLAHTKTGLLSVRWGPLASGSGYGLTPEEQLQKVSRRYLDAQVWLATEPARVANIDISTVDSYSAVVTQFSAPRGDGGRMLGLLEMIMTPENVILSASCTYDDTKPKLEQSCRTVLNSLRIQR